jgi:hypothetical protein
MRGVLTIQNQRPDLDSAPPVEQDTLVGSKMKHTIKIAWAQPGFEPGTSCTQSRNHTPRPLSHLALLIKIQ